MEPSSWSAGDETFQNAVRLEFSGCYATVILKVVGVKTIDEYRTGPFQLSEIDLARMAVETEHYGSDYLVALPLLTPTRQVGTSVVGGKKINGPTLMVSNGSYDLGHQDLARRHLRAWRDAAIGCGAKDVPDNLY